MATFWESVDHYNVLFVFGLFIIFVISHFGFEGRISSYWSLHIYTMQHIFSNYLCFASLFAHLSSILNNFNCNDENWILGK